MIGVPPALEEAAKEQGSSAPALGQVAFQWRPYFVALVVVEPKEVKPPARDALVPGMNPPPANPMLDPFAPTPSGVTSPPGTPPPGMGPLPAGPPDGRANPRVSLGVGAEGGASGREGSFSEETMRTVAMAGTVVASVFITGSMALAAEPDRVEQVPLSPKPGVYHSKAFLYTLTELPRAGSKPVLVGSLVWDNAPVAGGDYHRLELPCGSFIWYPPAADQVEIGWTRIDPEMKYDRWTMATIAEKKTAQGHWVTQPRDPIRELPPKHKPIVPTGREQ